MTDMKKLLLVLIVAFTAFACEESVQPQVLEQLNESWTHSREEQENPNGTTLIFRPSDSREFPVSHFRDAYEFRADGTCRYMYLHPADAHSMKEGTYDFDSDEKILSIYDADGGFLKSFKIIAVNKSKLVMELVQ